MPIKITARKGESTEGLLKRFKRTCSRAGLFREVKKLRFYEKPSEKRRRKKREALRQIRKAERRKEKMRRRMSRR